MKNQTFLTLPDDDGHQICPNCNSHMRYKYGGIFVCDKCGTETTNDYGKVKKYLDEHGPTNAIDLAQQTGVSSSKISAYLRRSRSREKYVLKRPDTVAEKSVLYGEKVRMQKGTRLSL